MDEFLNGKVSVTPTDSMKFGATFKRVDSPFCASLAMTINKSQEHVLESIGLHTGDLEAMPVFQPGILW